MKKVIIFIVVLLLLAVAIFIFTTRKTSHEDITTDIQVVDQKLSYNHSSINEENETTNVEAEFPLIEGLARKENINRTIQNFIQETIENFKKQNADIVLFENVKSTLGIEYEWREPRHNILSIPFLVYEYSSGAAHPNSYYKTLNFNIKTGSEVTLKDLFPENYPYLQEISTLSRDRINEFERTLEYPLEETWVLGGTEPKEENFETFVVERNNLKLIFNPYQIAPYVLGPVEVEIPFDAFKEINFPE